MAINFKVENVPISAERDRAMFNTFANNQSYVIKDIGNELAVTSSSSSFVVELGTGEAVICGGSMISEGSSTQLTLSASSNGYLVIEIDLSQTGANICQFKDVSSITQGNINNGDMIFDLPLYSYVTNASGVSSLEDMRNIVDSAGKSVLSGLAKVATTGSYNDLKNKPALKTVATTGSYNDLTNKPTIPSAITVDSSLSSSSTNPVQNKVVKSALDEKAPKNHSSSSDTYGLGTASNYGHVKLINNVTTSSFTNGLALSANQGKVLDDKITNLSTRNIGYITPDGKFKSDGYSKIADGDYLCIVDTSYGGVIVRSTIAFGTDTSKYLSNKGTWESISAGGLTSTVLWTNSNPTTSVGALTANCANLDTYKLILIIHSSLPSVSGGTRFYITSSYTYQTWEQALISGANIRRFTMSSSKISFKASDGVSEYNNMNIPYQIIGYK